MKKAFALLLALLLIVTMAACGGGDKKDPAPDPAPQTDPDPAPDSDSDPDPDEKGDAGDRTTIRFAAQADNTPATQAVIDAFNDAQEDYYAEWVDMTNDSGAMREQLITSLSAGSDDYDVLSLDVVWAGEFAAAGYIDPIDSYMGDAGLNMTDFNAGSMASGRYSAKQYVLPYFPDLGFLYYRSDIVSPEDAEKLDSGDYTWTELLTMAETYAGEEGTTDGFAFQAKQYEGLVCNANEFTGNWQNITEGLETMKAFVDSDAIPADILNYDEGATHSSFANGQSVFSRNWPYQWGTIKAEGSITVDQVGVAPLPEGGTVGGWLLAMNKNSQNKDGAWALMEFIATAEGQKIMSTQGGYLPGYNATLEDAAVIDSNELLSMEGFQAALATTIARPVSSDYAKISDDLQQAIHKYLSGSADIAETEAAVQEAVSEG